MKFSYGVLGGTFDRLHAGHDKLLTTAFENAEQVTIGLSTPELYKNKLLARTIETYPIREKTIKEYVKKHGFTGRANIIPIKDIYGPTLTDKNLQVIFATKENLPNVAIINTKRQEQGLSALRIITVEDVLDIDGKAITSERIRLGEIDRNGFAYKDIFSKKDTLIMPETLRDQLHHPLDTLVPSLEAATGLLDDKLCLIAVGDIVTLSLKNFGRNPDISIIDLRTRRHEISNEEKKLLTTDSHSKKFGNKPGTINTHFAKLFSEMIASYLTKKEKQTVLIDGEEDLLALPAILLAPLGSVVIYGQYEQGIVVNKVTEELKKKIKEILLRFT